MKRLMLFIEPTAAQLNIFTQFTLPRLGNFILAGLVNRQPGWGARVFVEGRQRFDLRAWIAQYGRPDVVGISTITATVNRGYALADKCRALGIPVILGGPHVTFLPEEALAHAELVVRGEGEAAMKALLELWNDGPARTTDPGYSGVPNLSWWDAGRTMRHNRLAPWITNLDHLPVPDFSLADGTADCLVGGKRTVMVQTSRGCPFDCCFCSVTGMFGKRFRYRSVESVLQELRQYNSREHFVFFCDDNFTANKRRARELVEAIAAENFRFQWSTQVRADLAQDPDLVRRMKRAGCHTVFIGFESVNPESLQEMKKKQNLEDILEAIRIVQAAGIHIHGMFVFGFENDDWGTVEATRRLPARAFHTVRASVRPGLWPHPALYPAGNAQEAGHRQIRSCRPVLVRVENQPGVAEGKSVISPQFGSQLRASRRLGPRRSRLQIGDGGWLDRCEPATGFRELGCGGTL
jgi:radical SAM superfamily enzyme YgiQ (UPF0313 family)